MNYETLISGLKALVAEANRHLESIAEDLEAAEKREKQAVRDGRWDLILCERDRISKLRDSQRIWFGRAISNLDRINDIQGA